MANWHSVFVWVFAWVLFESCLSVVWVFVWDVFVCLFASLFRSFCFCSRFEVLFMYCSICFILYVFHLLFKSCLSFCATWVCGSTGFSHANQVGGFLAHCAGSSFNRQFIFEYIIENAGVSVFEKKKAPAYFTQPSSSYPRFLLHFQFVFSHVNQVGGFSVHCADMSCNRHKKLWTFDSRILRMYCTEYVFWIVGHATVITQSCTNFQTFSRHAWTSTCYSEWKYMASFRQDSHERACHWLARSPKKSSRYSDGSGTVPLRTSLAESLRNNTK